MAKPPHVPVLLQEAVAAAAYRGARVVVDCTFGHGGYSEALLRRLAPKGRVVALDQDSSVFDRALEMEKIYGQARFQFLHGRFGDLRDVLGGHSATAGLLHTGVDSVVFDLGVSSMQLSKSDRGFSFRPDLDGPLDMRMDQHNPTSYTAADLVNTLTEAELARILREHADERFARRIAFKICYQRKRGYIASTKQLAELVREAVPRKHGRQMKIDEATKTFQALRMEVNNELGQLASGLAQASELLVPNGRLVVVSYHGVEDRLVKHFIRDDPTLVRATKKPLAPSKEEVGANLRARSAKMRIALKRPPPPAAPPDPGPPLAGPDMVAG